MRKRLLVSLQYSAFRERSTLVVIYDGMLNGYVLQRQGKKTIKMWEREIEIENVLVLHNNFCSFSRVTFQPGNDIKSEAMN